MTTNSTGGTGDDPEEGLHDAPTFVNENEDEIGDEATRILPLRDAGASPPLGTVIGSVGGSDADGGDDDKTVMLPAAGSAGKAREPEFDPAVGWLVILEGPGRGQHCSIFYGQNSVGRGEDQRIRLNFGDARITRDTHAFIVYDDLGRKFFLRDNGKSNLIRLNKSPVIAPVELNDRDQIQIGETVMLFVALCGPDFDWLSGDDGPSTGTES
ncbi:MAG: FHA domain-containing protein [Alphaproteobacteria bacterium]|nr:FHA domain-containing protein [Alphaproteobacteria bacterium]